MSNRFQFCDEQRTQGLIKKIIKNRLSNRSNRHRDRHRIEILSFVSKFDATICHRKTPKFRLHWMAVAALTHILRNVFYFPASSLSLLILVCFHQKYFKDASHTTFCVVAQLSLKARGNNDAKKTTPVHSPPAKYESSLRATVRFEESTWLFLEQSNDNFDCDDVRAFISLRAAWKVRDDRGFFQSPHILLL